MLESLQELDLETDNKKKKKKARRKKKAKKNEGEADEDEAPTQSQTLDPDGDGDELSEVQRREEDIFVQEFLRKLQSHSRYLNPDQVSKLTEAPPRQFRLRPNIDNAWLSKLQAQNQ